MAQRGKFKPKNPEKYKKGDPTKIIYRSRLELEFMQRMDSNPNVLEWASEEFSIPYRSPLDGEIHRYFPDIWCKIQKPDGKIETLVIEIKMEKENALNEENAPKRGNKLMRYYIREVARWGVNDAKFQAATAFCEDRGWKFQVVTEVDMGINYGESGKTNKKK